MNAYIQAVEACKKKASRRQVAASKKSNLDQDKENLRKRRKTRRRRIEPRWEGTERRPGRRKSQMIPEGNVSHRAFEWRDQKRRASARPKKKKNKKLPDEPGTEKKKDDRGTRRVGVRGISLRA